MAQRRNDAKQGYRDVDRYSSKILVAILIIIALSVLDALFTLDLVSRGAEEINPCMAYYLDRGPLMFFGVKYFLTCASIILILFSTNVQLCKTRMRAKILFVLMPIPFLLVVQWQVRLILAGF